MKYAVILYDGMADYPVPQLGGKTPMEVAKKPVFDGMGKKGEVGLVKTVDDSLKPGSDVANLSVLGFDPTVSYTGRSPLEAVSIGVKLNDTDVTLRCNLVTLSDAENYDDKIMIDYSAGDISTADAAVLIKAVQDHFGNDVFAFYPGVAYRHCLLWHNGTTDLGTMTPPHDISDRVIGKYLSTSDNAKELIRMMRESYDVLSNHPLNKERVEKGLRPANSIWLWGEGTKPKLGTFYDTYGLHGTVISAVDLLKGIGLCAGMDVPDVEGATGYIDTNFEGKARCAASAFANGSDFVYLHFEAPDECGHRAEPENKVRSIELIDEKVLPAVIAELEKHGDYKIMILPDHPTPIVTKTHARDAVPFMIYHKADEKQGVESVNENSAKETGVYFPSGVSLMRHFLGKD
mgnify:FL=1